MKDIKKIELEITSKCNAACPGCARTQYKDKVVEQDITLLDLKRIFPTKSFIENKHFNLCGVLGDPVLNPECIDIIEYIASNGGFCEVSTNGGIQTADWWTRLGEITSLYPRQLKVWFAVDGHRNTNHIYRVNTKFDVIERNMQAFAKTAPKGGGVWVYIVFDHNESEVEAAQMHAEQLGFSFAIRTGMRNSYYNWITRLPKEKQDVIITTTGNKEHSKKEVVKELDQIVANYNKLGDIQIQEVVSSIVCKHIHEKEIFIASDQTLWPCCFLWDGVFKNNESIREKLSFEDNWNNLKEHTIDDILKHPWYDILLEESWNPRHNMHLTRCIKTCAKNKAYHNEINYVVK
jgi:MoaA/NifB/PqqE/SkfB family radical SAM enzyme